ncbi:MAG: DUF4145 domain-containing protein [Phycisphaerales bacterium]|nr:DUF4145 domain-containing protein [Phycisphaerales bacterium]
MEANDSNFGFLRPLDHRLSRLGSQAENYVHSDPEACLFKLRLMVEMMASTLARITLGNALPPELGVTLGELERTGVLPRHEADTMHAIRRDGNSAVHGGIAPASTALRRLRDAHALTRWYSQTFKNSVQERAAEFQVPKRPEAAGGVDPQVAAAERLEDQIEERRRRTREALLLFQDDAERNNLSRRYRSELDALDAVAATAGEADIDAESMALFMALELEQLLEHPTFGRASRDARREAQSQLDAVKRRLEAQESAFREARERLTADKF